MTFCVVGTRDERTNEDRQSSSPPSIGRASVGTANTRASRGGPSAREHQPTTHNSSQVRHGVQEDECAGVLWYVLFFSSLAESFSGNVGLNVWRRQWQHDQLCAALPVHSAQAAGARLRRDPRLGRRAAQGAVDGVLCLARVSRRRGSGLLPHAQWRGESPHPQLCQ